MDGNRKFAVGFGMAALLAGCTSSRVDRPNIIFFLVDDWGAMDSEVAYLDRQYPRNTMFQTPNMLQMQEQGVLMANAYACPVSTPTRTSLMSGMHAVREHITSFTAPLPNIPTDAAGGGKLATIYEHEEDIFRRGEWNWNGVNPSDREIANTVHITPLGKLLQGAGYYTVHCGKAHWAPAGTPGATPYNMGFLVNIAGTGIGHPGSYQSDDNFGNTPEKWSYAAVQDLVQYYGTGTHLTEAITREALRAIEYPIEHGQPFFLNLAHFAVHTPIQPDSRYYQKYLDQGLDEGQAKFCSMVEGVDVSLGEVFRFLKEKGVDKNTVVILYGDNGGHSVDYSKGEQPHMQNLPLREGKGSCYEGGCHVPMMVVWPGRIAPGTRINTPVSNEDFFPTILEMAGIEDPQLYQVVDGQSLVGLLTDGSRYVAAAKRRRELKTAEDEVGFVVPESVSGIDPLRPVIIHYPHQWRVEDQPDIDFLSSVRVGDYKLVYRMHDFKLELYNLREDVGERNDIAAENPQIVADLAKILSDRLRVWQATMPVVRATGEPVPMPDELL